MGMTCDDTHMWLIPFGSNQEIRIDLKREQNIYGLRVWNYNKSVDDSFRGVKQLSVAVDGLLVSPRVSGFVLRKAPGTDVFDFSQVLRFYGLAGASEKDERSYFEAVEYPLHQLTYKTPIVRQDYEPPYFPQGLTLKFVFWNTWGDPYYLGINGMELFDYSGKRITTRPTVITASPHSVSDIYSEKGPAMKDSRIPENVLSGKDKNMCAAHDSWLAPLASSLGIAHGNHMYIVFDEPIVISLIKFWNYSKTPERGVKDMDIYVDDLHVFSGSLRKAPVIDIDGCRRVGTKPLAVDDFSQPVIFSTNQAQVDLEKRKLRYCGYEEQDVLYINDGQVVQESKAMYRKPDPGAEGVVVDLRNRPTTAMIRQ
ncbi:hypothetical protein PINS_up000920 [Pythium insidiosum]|nr:hypothetical protein PINS_up000920 [Pythium insidiosum]